MRIGIVGQGGMLGREVARIAQEHGHDLSFSAHWASVGNEPEMFINCAGKRPGTCSDIDMIENNSLWPHQLAAFNIPMIHMSTDCVFGGHVRAIHSSRDHPDPADIYGRSKLLGEVDAPHVLNVRGSFIGKRHGFLAWLLEAKGTIKVWKNAYWNGTSVAGMAEELLSLAESFNGSWPANVLHIASSTYMSKARMAMQLVSGLDLPISIEIVDKPYIWRVLEPDIELPPVEQMLDEIIYQQVKEKDNE